MCGRFASALKPSDAWQALMQEWPVELFGRYNVSPTSQIGAFVDGRCHAMRWGLVPSWSKQIDTRYSTFNARIEGIEDKPAFRDAWRKGKKCLIPALGYYEWQVENEVKQPYFITREDDQPLVFAGLWDECRIGDGVLESCTIITTDSVGELEPLHDRMPVMLDVDAAADWLQDEVGGDNSRQLLLTRNRAVLGEPFRVYAVDRRVNRSSEEGPELVHPLS